MAAAKLPRGVRLNNPGNLRHGPKWQGLAADQPDPDFATFTDATWGVRALAVNLITYQDKYDIHTVAAAIGRWAPESENDTQAYVRAVCKSAGFTADQRLDFHTYQHLCPLVEGIIRHENGRGPLATVNTWFSREVVDAGLARAGVVKPTPSAAGMPVTKETVAATGTSILGGAQLADAAPQVMAAIQSNQDHISSGSWVRIAFGVATILLAGWIAWSQLAKAQKGTLP